MTVPERASFPTASAQALKGPKKMGGEGSGGAEFQGKDKGCELRHAVLQVLVRTRERTKSTRKKGEG